MELMVLEVTDALVAVRGVQRPRAGGGRREQADEQERRVPRSRHRQVIARPGGKRRAVQKLD
jgi:hypothetical protein